MREFIFADPAAHRFGHAAEVRVRATLNLVFVIALEFEGDVVRPAFLTLEKAVVESGHASWGIYTKIPFTAECAEIAEDASSSRGRISFPGCSLLLSAASKYARLKEIRWGSSRPLKDFTV
jgi:hypothetical protein